MTEYEMFSSLQATLNIGMSVQSNFLALATAYLTAGYLAGHKLPLSMALFLTAAFLLLGGIFLISLDANYRTGQAIVQEMRNYAQAGKGFSWLPPRSDSALPPDVRHTVIQVIESLGVVASVYFFLQSRKANSGTQTQAPSLKA